MGIVNVTPDSFYEPSRRTTEAEVLRAVERIVCDGGQIVDVGGYSSRPLADDVSEEEEIRRLSWGLESILRVSRRVPVGRYFPFDRGAPRGGTIWCGDD